MKRARLLHVAVDDATREMDDVSHGIAGNVRVGVAPTMAQYLLPAACKAFLAEAKDVALQTIIGMSSVLRQSLKDGQIDLAVGVMSPTNEFISYPIVEDDVVVVAGDKHQIFRRRAEMQDLLAYRWVLPLASYEAEVRQWLERAFEPRLSQTNRANRDELDLFASAVDCADRLAQLHIAAKSGAGARCRSAKRSSPPGNNDASPFWSDASQRWVSLSGRAPLCHPTVHEGQRSLLCRLAPSASSRTWAVIQLLHYKCSRAEWCNRPPALATNSDPMAPFASRLVLTMTRERPQPPLRSGSALSQARRCESGNESDIGLRRTCIHVAPAVEMVVDLRRASEHSAIQEHGKGCGFQRRLGK